MADEGGTRIRFSQPPAKVASAALKTKGIATRGKLGPATRYVHPRTGRSVVVDNATGEVFHGGGDGFEYEP